MRSFVLCEEGRLTRRLLSIGHSYVVAQNRRLAHEMARQSRGRWDVTAVGPVRLPGDLREIRFEPIVDEASRAISVPVWLGAHPHLRFYGRGLRRLLRRERWDVVHCWEEPYVVAAAQVAALLDDGVIFVPATFQNIAKRYPVPASLLEARVLRRANGWIAFGQSVYDVQHARPLYAARPARVINPGVDVDLFRPDGAARRAIRDRLGWTNGEFVAGFTGRFIEAKGIGTLIGALERSARGWALLFVGGGPMQPAIDAVRARYPSRVRVVTDVPHDGVPAYLNAMDLLCAPSRTTPRWREQFGRMLIEAMACGVPVVASRSGEIPHVVAGAGVLLPEDDVRAWADTIDRLSDDRAALGELSVRGIDRARTVFAWPVVARAHLQFFEELCAG